MALFWRPGRISFNGFHAGANASFNHSSASQDEAKPRLTETKQHATKAEESLLERPSHAERAADVAMLGGER